MEEFDQAVIAALGIYVYRLIDPRTGQTFYVGKGSGNRVFSHARNPLQVENLLQNNADEDQLDLKAAQLQNILSQGMTVICIIHRHGIKSDAVAFQIEAALIDAYPGLTNTQGGHGSREFGAASPQELVTRYNAVEINVTEPFLAISINRLFADHGYSVYDAVRVAWKLNPENAGGLAVVAHTGGIVRGVFNAIEWMPATIENFPERLAETMPGRFGFKGQEVVNHCFLGGRIPQRYFQQGAQNPVRYIQPAPPIG